MKNISKSLLIAGLVSLSVISLNAQSNYIDSYVDVKKSKPIYKTVKIRVPYQEIVTKEYTVKVPCEGSSYRRVERNSIGLDTIVGMGLGVAIGNQIGKGNGRTAAKVVGGLLGAGIANSHRGYRDNTQYCDEIRYKDEAITRYDYRTEKKLQGYKNIFFYNGQKYTKITNHPLKRVKVTTSISF